MNGTGSDRDEHDIGVERLCFAAGRGLDRRLDPCPGRLDFRQLVGGMKGEALLLQRALHKLGHLAVHPRQDMVEKFHHHDLGTQPPPNRAELEADDAGADDDQLLRRSGEAQRASRGHDGLLIDLHARQPGHIRTGGDSDRLRFEAALLAVGGLDGHAAGRGNPACLRSPTRSCSS